METICSESIPGTNDEWRIGSASWDEPRNGGAGEQIGLKYAWPDSRGRMSRGGECPIAAVAQAIEFAVATGHLHAPDLLEAIARGERRRDVSHEH